MKFTLHNLPYNHSHVHAVAPAELEGHLLNHPDVKDTCVVGVPDEYSGEVPLAFVELSQDALARLQRDPAEVNKIKASIVKVRSYSYRAYPSHTLLMKLFSIIACC